MGERRQREQQEAPAVETVEHLGALETACTVLDNDVERLIRIFQAQQEVHTITAQVREVIATAHPLIAHKEALDAEIARKEARMQEIDAALDANEEALRASQVELAALHEQVSAAQRLRDELTALR